VSTVGKEIDLALHYLSIMKIRMGNRLDYSFVAPDKVTELRFPPAMLISLVENAIKHGLHSKEDGKLSISAFVERVPYALPFRTMARLLSVQGQVSDSVIYVSDWKHCMATKHGWK
jgi:LytS/YehU family sensor histidine kinase